MSAPVHGCPTCQGTLGADGCPRHRTAKWPAPLGAAAEIARLRAALEQAREALENLHIHHGNHMDRRSCRTAEVGVPEALAAIDAALEGDPIPRP